MISNIMFFVEENEKLALPWMIALIIISIFLSIFSLLIIILWIRKIVKLVRLENWAGAIIVFVLGLVLTPLIGWIASLFFNTDKQRIKLKEEIRKLREIVEFKELRRKIKSENKDFKVKK